MYVDKLILHLVNRFIFNSFLFILLFFRVIATHVMDYHSHHVNHDYRVHPTSMFTLTIIFPLASVQPSTVFTMITMFTLIICLVDLHLIFIAVND